MQTNNWYSIQNAGKSGVARIDIFDTIGLFGVRAKDFIDEFRVATENAKSVDLYLNSPGGEVFDGFAIYNTLRESKVPVDVTIYTAMSIASVIAMAGRSVEMADNGLFMIHNPRALAYGEEREMKKTINLLAKVKDSIISAYAGKTGMDRDAIAAAMDEETYYSAQEALDAGFINRISEAVEMAAHFDFSNIGYTPPPDVVARYGRSESRAVVGTARSEEVTAMSDQNPGSAGTPTNPVATYEDIVALCPGADAEFIVAQLQKKVSQDQARSNWTDVLAERAKTANAERDAAKQEAADLKAKLEAKDDELQPLASGGGKPIGSDGGDPVAEWLDLVASYEKRGYSKERALRAANQDNPELRERYVAAFNEANKRRR